jgi:hypothetical protein
MTFYMVRNKTGLYYQRGGTAWRARWVAARYASVWSTKNGPIAVLSRHEGELVEIEGNEVTHEAGR